MRDGFAYEPLLLGLALFSTFIYVELAWHRGDLHEDAVGTGGVETQRLRTRNYLSYDLGLALALAGAALGVRGDRHDWPWPPAIRGAESDLRGGLLGSFWSPSPA